jgi:glycosyltransferase involved in cell wall biosynthesis
MKVVHIDPGAGGTFYCQNCMRDCSLVKALRKQGHDVTMVPMYLPILIDSEGISGDTPVFFGGINVYLQQRFSIFRKTPRWLDKLFDTGWLLKKAAAQEGATAAAELGGMTFSMLQGPEGRQKKELDRLIEWLRDQEKPEAIHISNGLLLGLAAPLKEALGVPIICSLQDEKAWIHGMRDEDEARCWEAMAQHVEHVNQFIAVSQWYADAMAGHMNIPDSKMSVAYLGVEVHPGEHPPARPDVPVLGYLSKMTYSLGLGRLVDAFIELKRVPGLENLQLRATGGQHGDDIGYVAGLKKKLAQLGLDQDAEFLEEFNSDQRREFIQSLTVMSVPADEGEAFGLYILEALAQGVPVVQPDAGGFSEVVTATGGGLLYDVTDPDALVNSLKSLLLDRQRVDDLASHGRDVVMNTFTVDQMAKEVVRVYEALV